MEGRHCAAAAQEKHPLSLSLNVCLFALLDICCSCSTIDNAASEHIPRRAPLRPSFSSFVANHDITSVEPSLEIGITSDFYPSENAEKFGVERRRERERERGIHKAKAEETRLLLYIPVSH